MALKYNKKYNGSDFAKKVMELTKFSGVIKTVAAMSEESGDAYDSDIFILKSEDDIVEDVKKITKNAKLQWCVKSKKDTIEVRGWQCDPVYVIKTIYSNVPKNKIKKIKKTINENNPEISLV